ncbi:Dioxygenase [Nitrosovibrio tenuis]|uniref:Dioxygenase n=2 Tax=Nitrosovibrio tenuis TaxID=1233 RepID=A0A1H7Q9F1_9PROT|nr:Dioxygenase [Nitrosovibrio tenuis]
MLALLGATGITMLNGHSSASSGDGEVTRKMFSCIATPQQTEGPYFVDEHLRRADIRSDPSDGSIKEGLPLTLDIRVFSVGKTGCKPLVGAVVDIWHCDAQGIYSDVMDSHFNTVGKKFLRGYQITDTNGGVRFTTIYPGWYPGRTVHIHFKIRTDPKTMQAYEFTSQFYFDDLITDRVHEQPAYARKNPRPSRTRNEDDSIYLRGGNQLMLKLAQVDQGYTGSFDVGLEMGYAK